MTALVDSWKLRVGRIVGGLLFLLGVGLTWVWLHQIPKYGVFDEDWLQRHSEREAWRVEREAFFVLPLAPSRLTGTGRLSSYGDKEVFDRIIRSHRGYEVLGSCEGCVCSALAWISNQRFNRMSDYAAWCDSAREQSQEQWIRSGFERAGIKLAVELNDADALRLLGILGNRAIVDTMIVGHREEGWAEPDFLRYNAFRWLRDSGFDAVEFLTRRPAIELSAEQLSGAKAYHAFEQMYPRSNGVGLLSLGENDGNERFRLAGTPSWMRAIPLVVFSALCALGVWIYRKCRV